MKKQKKDFIKICKRIEGFFDCITQNTEYGGDFPISGFINDDEYYDRLHLLIDDEKFDDANDLLWEVRDIAFALGFAIGQSFEMTYPEAQKDIEVVKGLIKERGMLPYLPRGRKAA